MSTRRTIGWIIAGGCLAACKAEAAPPPPQAPLSAAQPVAAPPPPAAAPFAQQLRQRHAERTRANALEGNVRLYTVKDGQRRQLATWSGTVKSGAWHELRVDAKGDQVAVTWDGVKVIDHRDGTFMKPGRAGVWTKADSFTYFDDLSVEGL